MSVRTKPTKYKFVYTDSTSSESESDIFSKMEELNSNTSKDNLVILPADTRKQTMGHKTELQRVIYENITTVVHVLSLQFVIFILYLAFSHEIELFTWHPILLAVGWCCLITEGVLSLSSDNFLTKYLAHRNKVFLHWLLQGLATITICTGFAIVYINKTIKNKQHFKTWHGIFGLVTLICVITTFFMGISTLYRIDLKRFIKPYLNKTIHLVCAIITLIFGTVSVVLSLYSNWFTKKNSTGAQVLCFIVILVTAIWILIRPVIYLRKLTRF